MLHFGVIIGMGMSALKSSQTSSLLVTNQHQLKIRLFLWKKLI